jgi:hypothetical protein
MNRNDEYIELMNELQQTPERLEDIAMKAISHAKRSKRISLSLKIPILSFCFIIAAFIMLVNLYPSAAFAMSKIPLIKELVNAVAFDPNLKRAVENDFYQVIGDSQTQQKVTVSVDYMILDAGHISLFFHVSAPDKEGSYSFDLLDDKGQVLPAVYSYDTIYESDQLEEIKIELTEQEFHLPDKITFKIEITPCDMSRYDGKSGSVNSSIASDTVSPYNDTNPNKAKQVNSSLQTLSFSFTLSPDKEFSQTSNTIDINQWITIKKQRIYLEHLTIYPSQARLFLKCDQNNSAVIKDLDICFQDEHGKQYAATANGISSTGSENSQDISSLYYESSYFTKAKHLTLTIKGVSFIEKDRLYGEIHSENETITNLPEGISVDYMNQNGSTLTFSLKVNMQKPNCYKQIMASSYYDHKGIEYNFGSWSTDSADVSGNYSVRYEIKDYVKNKYKINWIYAPMKALEEPITMDIY